MDQIAERYSKDLSKAFYAAPSTTYNGYRKENSSPSKAGRSRRSLYRSAGKRIFDITFATIGLIATAPILLLLVIVVWIEGGQPIFRHIRIGQGRRPFRCLKIRSMRRDAEERLVEILAADPQAAAEWAANQKLDADPRVTRIGSILRRSSLDELPQFLNVLRGEMSLVGPRPVTESEVERYGVFASSYAAVRPGLTGPWQVSGRNGISFAERVALDVDYARNHSLLGDAAIVAKTALSMLRMTGR